LIIGIKYIIHLLQL